MFLVSKSVLTTILCIFATQSASVDPSRSTLDCSLLPSGVEPHPTDCAKYYECVNGIKYSMTCSEGQIFDIRSSRCGDIQTSLCASNNQVEGQIDLLIIFDATGSMATDLAQLRSAAIEIVNELSRKEEDPINNFVLSVFRDPDVEDVFVTTDSGALISGLNKIEVRGGGDCPELGMLGLKNALEVAAPYSVAFLFSDASAKDYELKDEIVQIVLQKQIRVYFLLTGNCGKPNSPEALVYGEIARVSDGQVFNMKNSQVKDVLVALGFMLDTKFEALMSFDFEEPGNNVVRVNIDSSFEEVLISVSGKNSKLKILNSMNQTVAISKSFSSSNVNIAIFDVHDSEYLIDTSAESEYSIRIGGISEMSFNFGFSLRSAVNLNETQKLPIADKQNILTVFVTNTRSLKYLQSVSLVSVLDNSISIEIPLSECKSGVFATVLFSVPEIMFNIRVSGRDNEDNIIERIISTGIETTVTLRPTLDCSLLSSEVAPHPKDCIKYNECINGITYEMTCPEGQIFDIHSLRCGDFETSVCAH